jgi:hypothetical protein
VTELRTEPVFEALKQPLALIESDERRRAIETYIEAARVPLERAVFDLMSQLAQEIDAKTGEQLRIRLAYHAGGLSLEVDEKTGDGDEARWSATEGGDVEKITIRIPAELKELATEAASQAGTSANTWFIKALARALRNSEMRQESTVWRDDAGGSSRSRGHGSSRGGRIQGWVGGDED